MTPLVAQATAESVAEVISEDKELVLAFKRGESSAYDVIYERHQARVQNVCRRMLSDSHDAQEAAQETFLRVYQALGRFNGRYQLGAWIGRIATNVCLDQLRSKSRKPAEAAPIETLELAAGEISGDDPEAFVIRNAESRRVRKVLDGLAPLHRAAIVLRDFEGFSYGEIAATLKLTEPQVKALLHRARKGFRRSWTSSIASILIPTRLFQRIGHKIRAVESNAVEHATQSVSTVQIVHTCSAALQHCGQVLVDKGAAVAVSLAVGVAAGAVATDRIKDATENNPARVEVVAPVDSESKKDEGRARNEQAKRERRDRHAPAEAVAPAPAEPTQEPTPSASPSPSTESDPEPTPTPNGQAGSGGNTGGHSDSGSRPTPPPVPAFTAGLGFTRSGAVSGGSSVTEHSFSVDCSTTDVEQKYDAPFKDGSSTYGSHIDLDIDGSAASFELQVFPQGDQYGGDVRYEGAGNVTSQTREGDRLKLTVTGTYENVDHDAQRAGFPGGGSFDLHVELDCRAATVITEVLGLAG